MKDYYFQSLSLDAINGMLYDKDGNPIYRNVLGPLSGRLSAGDPLFVYVNIRVDDSVTITPTLGVTTCDTVTGQSVLGVWE